MCVGEKVAGGDAADCLVHVHGCDLSGSPGNTPCNTIKNVSQTLSMGNLLPTSWNNTFEDSSSFICTLFCSILGFDWPMRVF